MIKEPGIFPPRQRPVPGDLVALRFHSIPGIDEKAMEEIVSLKGAAFVVLRVDDVDCLIWSPFVHKPVKLSWTPNVDIVVLSGFDEVKE